MQACPMFSVILLIIITDMPMKPWHGWLIHGPLTYPVHESDDCVEPLKMSIISSKDMKPLH